MAGSTTKPAEGVLVQAPGDCAVEFRGITKRFGPVIANEDVTFGIRSGSIHGIVGENGAGKSTLMSVLFGLYKADAGTILLNGRPSEISSPSAAIREGLGMVHQHFMLVERMAVPLIFAATAGLYAEKAGAIDIGLEGKMLVGAFAAGACASLAGSAWAGLGGAVAAGIMLALAQAFASIHLRGNQLVIGLAVNIIASGLTAFLGIAWYQRGGQTPQLGAAERFPPIQLPGAQAMAGVPVVGPIYSQLVSNNTLLSYGAFAAVLVTAVVLYRTRFGLRLQACGDKPEALDTAGVSVFRIRYTAFVIDGALCGVGGAYLSLIQGGAFYKDMTAGQGYMALAALIFGNWRPGRVLVACLLFALADAAQGRMQGSVVAGFEIPTQLIQAIPYILTLLLLAGVVGKAEGPAAAGQPYVKGER